MTVKLHTMTQTLSKRPGPMNQNTAQRDDNWSTLLQAVAKQGDQQAFARLFDHFGPLIKGFCLSQSRHGLPDEAAEELVQEVMLKVWLKASSFDPHKASASTWVFTMMRNCRIDMLRRQSKHHNNAEELVAEDLWDENQDNQPFVRLEAARNRDHIQSAFTELPNEQKQALTQVYMQGKSHSEIANETGLPLGTVKSRVRMGLKKLQSHLGGRV